MQSSSLRIVIIGTALVCLLQSATCLAGGYSFSHPTHQPHERHHRLCHPAPKVAVIESVAIRRVARPAQEDAQRPDQSLENRVTKLENNFNQLNQEVSRLADLLQRQIDLLDTTR